MTKEELEQFTALAKKYTKGEDKDAVLAVLKADMHEVFQEVNDGGRAAANVDNKKTVTELETAKKQAEDRAAAAEQKAAELEKKAPDVTAVRTQYESQITELQAKHKKDLQAKDQLLDDFQIGLERGKLVDELDAAGIDREYAAEVLAKRDDVRNRFRKREDGKVGVLKAPDSDMFFVAGEKTAVQLLAEELAAKVGDKWKKSKVAGKGTGVNNEGGGGPDGDGKLSERAKKIREEEAQRGKAATEGRSSGFEKLSGRKQ